MRKQTIDWSCSSKVIADLMIMTFFPSWSCRSLNYDNIRLVFFLNDNSDLRFSILASHYARASRKEEDEEEEEEEEDEEEVRIRMRKGSEKWEQRQRRRRWWWEEREKNNIRDMQTRLIRRESSGVLWRLNNVATTVTKWLTRILNEIDES